MCGIRLHFESALADELLRAAGVVAHPRPVAGVHLEVVVEGLLAAERLAALRAHLRD